MTRFLFLIPLLPLLGFVLNFVFGVRLMRHRLGLPGPGLGKWPDGHGAHAAHAGSGHPAHADAHGAAHGAPPALIGIIACGSVLLSFLVSVYAAWQAHHAPGHT